MKNNQKGFSHILLFVILFIVIGLIGFTGWRVYKYESGGPSGLAECQGTNLFSVSPAAIGTYDYLEPLGHTSANNGSAGHIIPVDHMYFYFKHTVPGNMNSPTIPVTIQAPSNGEIYRVVSTNYQTNGQTTDHDYDIYFAPCNGVYVHLAHINSLNPTIQNVLNKATTNIFGSITKHCDTSTPNGPNGPAHQECKYNVNIKLSAGDKIGTAGGPGTQTMAFDFGVYNTTTKPLPFIDTKYMYSDNLHAVCGISYYPAGPIKTALYNSLKTTKVDPNGQKDCGTNMWDKIGTIQGNWHLPSAPKGQGLDNQYGLSISHYDMDPSQANITWGGTIGPANTIDSPIQASGLINRDPASITANGKVYCYENEQAPVTPDSNGNYQVVMQNSVDLQLINSTTLKIEYHQGSCSTTPTLTNPTTYFR